MRHSMGAGTSVVQRIVAVIEPFSRPHSVIRLMDICDETGLPKATVHRLVQQLVEMEVVQATEGGYVAGRRLWAWSLAASHARVRGIARPLLEDLRRRSGWTVHLGLLHHMDVIYIDKLSGQGSPILTRVGGREPGHCTALGKAMLAYETPNQIGKILKKGLHPRTPDTITDPEKFLRSLTAVANNRLAFDNSEHTIGLTCIAAPIMDANNRVMAAVSLSGLSRQFEPTRFERLLRRTAESISQVW